MPFSSGNRSATDIAARSAPCWISSDRAARIAAIEHGAAEEFGDIGLIVEADHGPQANRGTQRQGRRHPRGGREIPDAEDSSSDSRSVNRPRAGKPQRVACRQFPLPGPAPQSIRVGALLKENGFAFDLDLGVGIDQGRDLTSVSCRKMAAKRRAFMPRQWRPRRR